MSSSHPPLALKDLPVELVLKIFSFLNPADTSKLRKLITACHNTDHEIVSRLAGQILRDRRRLLLDRWRDIHSRTSMKGASDESQSISPQGIESIAEALIGKEYAPRWIIVDDDSNDEWTFKKTHPVLNNNEDISKIRICTEPSIDTATCTKTPQETHYEYDDDPCHEARAERNRYSRAVDPRRLNIEVDLFGRYVGTMYQWNEWLRPSIGVFEGVCVGLHWG